VPHTKASGCLKNFLSRAVLLETGSTLHEPSGFRTDVLNHREVDTFNGDAAQRSSKRLPQST